ncbi:MAG: helix-turn-helix domain-containing protein [Coriobacteriales bacterium]|jgi:hypothetical protein|nr:helix-turn-helix domain-containing protein [Coriobacteriales bacterium]
MLLDELVHILKSSYRVSQVSSETALPVTSVRAIDENLETWDPNTLYVGDYQVCQSLCQSASHAGEPRLLLCANGCPKPQDEAIFVCVDCEDQRLPKLIEEIQEHIDRDLREDSLFFEFKKQAVLCIDFYKLVEKAALFLQNPLVVYGHRDRIITYANLPDDLPSKWRRALENGRLEGGSLVQEARMKQWKRNVPTHYVPRDGDQSAFLVTQILRGGHNVYGVLVFEYMTEFSRRQERYLPFIAEILYEKYASLHEDDFLGNQRTIYGNFLYKLLSAHEEVDIPLEHELSGISFQNDMRVVAARYSKRTPNRHMETQMVVKLEHIFPNGHSIVYKSYSGILVDEIDERQSELLRELAKSEQVTIGISWPFRDIYDFKMFFGQAVAAIKIADRLEPDRGLAPYDDFVGIHFIETYAGSQPLERFIYPGLQKLKAYDQDKSADLYETLYQYICHLKNRVDASAALFIHKNTLLYRINQITELLSLSLDDPKVIQMLLLAFAIDKTGK